LKTLAFRRSARLAATCAFALCAVAPEAATAQRANSSKPASVASLVAKVAIPHSSFTLANGLKVLVHEDHKAPIAAVAVWYNVGAKDEPKGKTGFAHLFEHLLFNGSENLPGDYFTYLQQIGATDYNGDTFYDRTRYFETVPKGALERALFMESDRMGYLLGAVTQGVLDNQRSVVQNEKRQFDSAPGGLGQYTLLANLFPAGHPYHHTAIGSMEDLDAASLADVKQWFREKYGPNNAVLVVAGDVTPAQVRPLAEKYFEAIGRGPVNHPAMAGVPTLAEPKSISMKDAVAATIVSRYWAVPGLLDKQFADLDIGTSVLGGLASSRFNQVLVRGDQVALSAIAHYQPFQRAGIFTIQSVVKPGTDPAVVAKRMDEVTADFLAKGPTADEVQRAVMAQIAGQVRGLEQIGGFSGKAVALAQGQTFALDSNFYKKTLAEYAGVTPSTVRAVLQQWLKRPALTITLLPGPRDSIYVEAKAKAASQPKVEETLPKPTRAIPPVGPVAPLVWPTISRTKLSNGIELVYAQRTAVPLTQVALAFDAGGAGDPVEARGLSAMTMGLLSQGADGMTTQQIAEAEERLGVNIAASSDADRSIVSMSALTPNLKPSLDLLADIVERPTFDSRDLDRLRAQTLTGLAQLLKDPQQVGARVLPGVLFGNAHPYGAAPGGDPAAISKFTRADLVAYQQRWLRPDNVKIFVVSDQPLDEIERVLESEFGKWNAPAVPKGTKTFPAPPQRPTAAKVMLVDRPGAPQAMILGGEVLPLDPRSEVHAFNIANDALGGNFLSRLNMDLRETKGWSYKVSGSQSIRPHGVTYTIAAPVQADRAADSLAALDADMKEYLSTKGMTQDERDRAVVNSTNELPGQFETSGALLSGMMRNDLMGRPDNYYATLAGKYSAVTTAAANQAIRANLDPKGFSWVVVGDAAKIRPELDKLGIPIEIVEPN